ncbi:ArsR family transcriptional regulator [Candidatus Aerophobetes bacterium]|uniref:ArsR family transcriptional regulator n=1 Tax=Aerophobetes bacterium TaxID=2030807 RepID=A0A523W343_UNCAE|nr:MAG: ArsR family transcriptional regulator [Candidatus Aerophobetes bacterium]
MDEIITIFKALSDPTRFKIFFLLSRKTLCVNALVNLLQISQPAVSQHLGILKQADLVEAARKGYWMHYSVNERRMKAFLNEVRALLRDEKVEDKALMRGKVAVKTRKMHNHKRSMC